MNRPGNRVWASLALLSIIAPVGLLATFRLTGILREPSKSDVITVETVPMSMSRPTQTLNMPEVVRNSYATSAVSIDFNITGTYVEQHSDYDYNDALVLVMTANLTLSEGFVHSITVHFSEIDTNALLDAEEDPDNIELHNLSSYRVRDLSAFGEDAYITAEGSSNSKQCILNTSAGWIFTDQDNQNHGIRIVLEVVYQQSGTYRQVNLPISLQVTGN